MDGLRIAEICRERGIMQKELANMLGITSVGLAKALRGYPNIKTLENIANALQVPISALFVQPSSNTLFCPHCGKAIHLNPTTEEKQTNTTEETK